jgi:hypothetical protein
MGRDHGEVEMGESSIEDRLMRPKYMTKKVKWEELDMELNAFHTDGYFPIQIDYDYDEHWYYLIMCREDDTGGTVGHVGLNP